MILCNALLGVRYLVLKAGSNLPIWCLEGCGTAYLDRGFSKESQPKGLKFLYGVWLVVPQTMDDNKLSVIISCKMFKSDRIIASSICFAGVPGQN